MKMNQRSHPISSIQADVSPGRETEIAYIVRTAVELSKYQ